jgi:uncharacterized membrane protein YvlD (DUF360 family)
MKRLLRIFIIETTILYIAASIARGIVFENGFTTLVLAGVGMSIASMVVKPVINLLLLPINLITFNLFKWVSSAITLYLVTLVVPGFKILSFGFPGFSSEAFDLPTLELAGVASYIAFSFIIAFLGGIIYWLISQK